MELYKGYLFHDRYLLVSLLGTGASAQVWKAKDTKANNLLVALKIFDENSEMSSYGLQAFEKQFTIVFNMKHSNLLPPTGYDIFQGRPYLVMQYCENGNCSSMAGRMEEDDIIKFLHDVAAGLEYLHDHNIIHQDIKPDNIMLDDNCNFMVTDFGISVSSNNNIYDSSGTSGGTRAYMGPERFEGITLPASDMWALGASAVELLTKNPPYGEHGGLLQAQGEPLPELPTKLQPEVKSMILSCLVQDPNHRIKANEIRQKIELYWETGSWKKPSQKKTIAIIATAVASILMCLGLFLWDYNRTKTHYYKDYVEAWGIPEGIGRISPWEAKHMHRLYRFESKQGKVRRVSHVNSLGVIIPDNESERNERPIDQNIYYTSEGKVSRIKVRDNNGKVLFVKAFNENLSTMSFQYDDKHNTERALAAQSVGYGRLLEDNSANKSKITRWLLDYNKEGYVTRIRFAGLDNSPAHDDNNIYGREMVYDSKGHVIEIHYIGKNDEPKSTKWGLGIKKFIYDDNDNWIRAEYYTVDEQAAYDDKDGVSVYEMEYDDKGNLVTMYHKDGNGGLMLPKKNGVAGANYEYDDNGFVVKETYLGTDNTPIFVASTGYAGYTAKYDKNGFIIEQEFIDPDGMACETSQGNSKLVQINDKSGNVLESWNYNLNGELSLDPSGIAGRTYKYDSIGNIVEMVYYGKDKNPTLDEQGEAGIRLKYDERNLMTEWLSLDENLNPAFNENHVCLIRYEYDSRGNMTKIAFHDTDGNNLVQSNENVAGWNIVYDDLGNEIERSFFDNNNSLCEVVGGYAKMTTTYDQNGHLKTERYYNASGSLTTVNGIAGADYVCDERGNIVVYKPISTDGKLAAGKVETHYKYDKFDNRIEESYFSNGNAVNVPDGYHKTCCTFNSRNAIIEVSYYNKDSELTLTSSEGIAKLKNEYDNKGNRIKCFYYGTDSKPIVGKEGWASSTYEYDAFGNTTKQCFFGIDGKPTDPKKMVPVGICEYDKHNNMIYIAAQDGNGNFIINPNTGWAISRMEYDNRSQMLSQSYYDEHDKPMKGSNGCHKTTYKYDGYGNTTEEAYFGADRKPTLVNGVHLEKYTYDEKGNMTVCAFYNQSEKPTNCDAGFHKFVITYDNGTPVSKKYYALNGSLIASQSYNKKKGEWNAPKQDWRSSVREANNECPIKLYDGVFIQSVKSSGNSITITIRLSEVSQFDMDEEMKANLSKVSVEMKSLMRGALEIPSNVPITVVFIDKANHPIG